MKNNWPFKKLGEIGEIYSGGKSRITKANYVNSGFPAYSAAGQDGFTKNAYDSGFAVILSSIGSRCGKCFYAEGKWTALANTQVIKFQNQITAKFMYFYLNDEKKWPKSGTGQPFISPNVVKNFVVPIPPLHIQQKIVYVLDAVQSAIEIHQKIIEKTKELKKSMMAELFRYGAPSFRKGRKLKETEIGEIPEDWEVVKLGEVTERPQYGLTLSMLEEKTEIKFLRITDIQDEKVNWNLVPYCKCSTKDFEKYKLNEEDIVIARIGATTGKSFIIKYPPKAVFGSYLIRIRCKSNLISNFANGYLQTSLYWKQINLAKGGKLKGGINIPILQNLLFPLPSLDEQKEIAEILTTIDKKIEIEQKKKELYEELFKTLLNKIMNQEIEIENLG